MPFTQTPKLNHLLAALSLDRLPGNRLVMTQELIANMLGVRREGVTAAAGNLRMQGAISLTHGLA